MTNQPNNQSSNQKSDQKQSNNQGSRADQPTPVSAATQQQGQNMGQSQGQSSSGDLKQAGREMASDAKNAVTEAKNTVTEAASNATSQVKEQVSDLTQNVQEQATNYLGEQKGMAADRLEGVASALRNVGQEFNERDEGTLAHYTDSLADQIERFSGSLRDREIGSLVDDARQLAYRQPEWFVAGALAVGFALGRFFKSSQRSRYNNRYDSRYDNGGYDNGGYGGQRYGDQRYGEQSYGGRGYDQQGYRYGSPSDYSEGSSSNYGRGYTGGQGSNYEGGMTGDYSRSVYRNPDNYSQGQTNPNASLYGNSYEGQGRSEISNQPGYQGSRDYDAGYRSDTRPEFSGSNQSSQSPGQPTTHGLGTGQSVQREDEIGSTNPEETMTANKATQSNKPQGSGQGDSQQGARK